MQAQQKSASTTRQFDFALAIAATRFGKDFS
jgi:hypothetical protein